jgi:hypothetical protein
MTMPHAHEPPTTNSEPSAGVWRRRASRGAFGFLVLCAVQGTVRAGIHMLAPDGGAHSIAGLDVDVEGGRNLIALFGQWGAVQMLLAVIYWAVILRHRQLVTLMLWVIALDQLLRWFEGQIKPLVVSAPPPGAWATWIMGPLSLLALALVIWGARGTRRG